MKNKITSLLLGAALCLNLAGPAFAFAPPAQGETTSTTDQNGNTQLEITDSGSGGGNKPGSDPTTPTTPPLPAIPATVPTMCRPRPARPPRPSPTRMVPLRPPLPIKILVQ